MSTRQEKRVENMSDEEYREWVEAHKRIMKEKRGRRLPRETQVVEICLPNEETKRYLSYEKLREDIMLGTLKKHYKARLARKKKWSTLEQISKVDHTLHLLYRPVLTYAARYLSYGIVAWIILKALDTAWLFFEYDLVLAIFWLIVAGIVFASGWVPSEAWGPIFVAVMYVMWMLQMPNLFFTTLGVVFFGAAFGAPGGMIVGTIVGHVRKGKLTRAPDAEPEGRKPYLFFLLIPLIFLATLVLFYVFWLNPMLLRLLS